MPRDYEKRWPDCDVHHLVLSNERFIVFLDDALDIDWTTGKVYEGYKDQKAHNAIINDAALLEATPCNGLPVATKTQFKRLIGEGIARSLDHDYDGAKKMLRAATDYILARSQETSRWWYLSASAGMTLPFVVLGGGFWLFRTFLIQSLGEGPFWLFLAGCAGAVGALLSVIGRAGKQTFDCSAGQWLHYLEGASRICAGAISGLVIGLAVRSELVLAVLARGTRMATVMVLAAVAAGYGERLATSIISDITNVGSKPSGEAAREATGNDNYKSG
ncbi:MAG TPA: hypothetical protein VGR79_13695 [Stellaceae bacterium]|nr:hypothetical protein [Stellaceae bacterium]